MSVTTSEDKTLRQNLLGQLLRLLDSAECPTMEGDAYLRVLKEHQLWACSSGPSCRKLRNVKRT